MVIGLFGHAPWACTTAGAASARPEALSTERRVVVILFIGLMSSQFLFFLPMHSG